MELLMYIQYFKVIKQWPGHRAIPIHLYYLANSSVMCMTHRATLLATLFALGAVFSSATIIFMKVF